MKAKGLYGPDRPVFPTRNGTIIRDRNFNRKWEILKKKAKLPDELTPHCLRHTFATRMLEAGVPMKMVQEFLGHARLAHTADIYSHMDEMIEGVRGKMHKALVGTKLGTKKGPGLA